MPKDKAQAEKSVYMLDELALAESAVGSWDSVKGLLGGKGANLAEMTRLGLPVPPGFIVTTAACKAYLASSSDSRLPPGLWQEVVEAVERLERATGKRLGDATNPLLVACRSGAKVSMPGMMDTVLNIGINEAVVERLAELTGDRRFAFDSYRRLIQMFSTVVLGLPGEPFESCLASHRSGRAVAGDADLPAGELEAVTAEFKAIVQAHTTKPFPSDPLEQLSLSVKAVFASWNGKRAHDYRVAAGIAHDLGTAVNVVAMVFGNLGDQSGTGVATTRNVTTGAKELEGDFLLNAQGEDVVSGTRQTLPVAQMASAFPGLHAELTRIAGLLERHYREAQDVEFTIERGKLWMLQTRDAKRTAQAAIRIAVEMVHEKLVTREEALMRVSPTHVDYFLHPQFEVESRRRAKEEGALIATGLNVSPGAAIGQLAFDADTAEMWAQAKKSVVMVRPETKPEDVHGLLAAQGVLTSQGGRTSHAALVARQFGKPAVVGASTLKVDVASRRLIAPGGRVLNEGDWVSIDGTTGEVFRGKLATVVPDVADEHLLELLGWADDIRRLGVWANADYPKDAQRARQLGAQGIGLCRTEHMFFQTERLPIVQRMILAETEPERGVELAKLLPLQREDFKGLFRAMDGLPVTIRLIDPPLHEFLPNRDVIQRELAESAPGPEAAAKRKMLAAIDRLHEQNPMLGLRGVRLGILMPELIRMQVRALFEAACTCAREGVRVKPKVMVPLATLADELRIERALLEEEAQRVMTEQGLEVPYQFGTMIEVPRAALVADRLAEYAEFFSFGTNDLTQTTFGISRDDAETSFLMEYLRRGILRENPFATLDVEGVGAVMKMAVERIRSRRKSAEIGICGEHGGDPKSIELCDALGLDYVSCSPLRVPVARLAAAQAVLKSRAATRPAEAEMLSSRGGPSTQALRNPQSPRTGMTPVMAQKLRTGSTERPR